MVQGWSIALPQRDIGLWGSRYSSASAPRSTCEKTPTRGAITHRFAPYELHPQLQLPSREKQTRCSWCDTADSMDACSPAEQLLLEALSLPEALLFEHHEDDHRRAVLQGRVSAIACDVLGGERETVESSLNLDGLDLDSGSPLERESCTPAPDECVQPPSLGLGMRRQPSFMPASILTDEEQQSVRSRRRACVLQLARSAMGLAASKISKCPRRWHSRRQAESARPGEPAAPFSAPEEKALGSTPRSPSRSLFSSARGENV